MTAETQHTGTPALELRATGSSSHHPCPICGLDTREAEASVDIFPVGGLFCVCQACARTLRPDLHAAAAMIWTRSDSASLCERVRETLTGLPDESLPYVLGDLQAVLDEAAGNSPECRRNVAAGLAEGIARSPGIYRHSIGEHDAILKPATGEPTGYRMQDFLPEIELATYRTYVYGSPEADADHSQHDDPPEIGGCPGDCAGGHWAGGTTWHYTAAGRARLGLRPVLPASHTDCAHPAP